MQAKSKNTYTVSVFDFLFVTSTFISIVLEKRAFLVGLPVFLFN